MSTAEIFSGPLRDKLANVRETRMDVKNEDERNKIPQSIRDARKLREHLKKTAGKDWPASPASIDSEVSFFNQAQETVSHVWSKDAEDQESSQQFLAMKCAEWAKELAANDDEEDTELIALLSDPDQLKERLFAKKINILEPLREKIPEAWETLLMFSSEVQLAQVALSRRWLREMPEAAFENSGFSKTELLLQNELAATVGKLVDHGYLKQDELDRVLAEEDVEETSEGEAGRKYAYALPGEEGEVARSIVEVLPAEIKRFSASLERIAGQVDAMIAAGFLDERYTKLPGYLSEVAHMYGSQETNKAKLYEGWKKLYEMNAELLKDGCPLVINPQEDDTFSVVGFEMRLGLRSRELQELEKRGSIYTDRAYATLQKLTQEQPGLVQEDPKKVDVFLTNQAYAFGSNLPKATMAESYHGQMFLHVNEVQRMARDTEIPILQRTFGVQIDEAAYLRQAQLETMRHEVAHSIVASEDAAVTERMGESDELNILEELKAETVGMGLIREDVDTMTDEEAHAVCLAKLGTEVQYIVDKSSEEGESGEDYYVCGVKIMTELLKTGLLELKGDQLSVRDPKAVIAKIAEIGDEVLQLYKNLETTPDDVATYAGRLREMKQDPDFLKLKEVLKQAASAH